MNIKTKLILFLGIVCFLYSCTKKEFEGPSIEILYGDFEIIEPLKITNKKPSFSNNEQIGFHCEFNKPVEWKIAILGLSTGASREITGFSNLIDSNIISWNGGPSQVPFFSVEDCAFELTFENEIDTIRDTINIVSAKTYENGIWFEDFEDGLPTDGLVYYNTDGGGMTFSVANDDALLGSSYFKMGGRVNWDWALGSLDLPLNINNVSQNSDDLFINIGILSDLQDLHTFASLRRLSLLVQMHVPRTLILFICFRADQRSNNSCLAHSWPSLTICNYFLRFVRSSRLPCVQTRNHASF